MKPSKEDIQKANNKGNREAFLDGERYKTLTTKIYKNKKKYTRKKKNKKKEE